MRTSARTSSCRTSSAAHALVRFRRPERARRRPHPWPCTANGSGLSPGPNCAPPRARHRPSFGSKRAPCCLAKLQRVTGPVFPCPEQILPLAPDQTVLELEDVKRPVSLIIDEQCSDDAVIRGRDDLVLPEARIGASIGCRDRTKVCVPASHDASAHLPLDIGMKELDVTPPTRVDSPHRRTRRATPAMSSPLASHKPTIEPHRRRTFRPLPTGSAGHPGQTEAVLLARALLEPLERVPGMFSDYRDRRVQRRHGDGYLVCEELGCSATCAVTRIQSKSTMLPSHLGRRSQEYHTAQRGLVQISSQSPELVGNTAAWPHA